MSGERRRLVLPIVVAVVAAIVVVLGIGAGLRWSAERKLAAERALLVVTVACDRSAEENESQIAEPLEQAIAAVAGVHSLRSESRRGAVVAAIVVSAVEQFEIQQRLSETISKNALKTLPSDARPPMISRVAPDQPAWLVIGDEKAKEELERLSGVGAVEVCGAKADRVHVVLDPARASALNVDVGQVVLGIAATTGMKAMINGGHVDPEEMSKTRIGTREPEVRLSDVAVIERRSDARACGLVRGSELGEGDGLLLRVERQPMADEREVRSIVEAKVKQIGARFVDPSSMVVLAYDAPRSRPEAFVRASWLVKNAGPRTLGVLVRDHDLHVVRLDPTDTDGSKSAAALNGRGSPDAPTYAGVTSAPKGRPTRLRLTVRGPELDALAKRASELRTRVEGVSGIGLLLGPPPGNRVPHLDAKIDRDAAARLALPVDRVFDTLKAVTSGIEVGGVIVHLGRGDPDDELSTLRSATVKGIPLQQVMRFEQRSGPETILHVDRQRAVELRWEVTRDVVSDVTKAIAAPDVRVELERSSP